MSKQHIPSPGSKRDLTHHLLDDTAAPAVSWGEIHSETVAERLQSFGISRRGFMQFCAGMASLLALPPSVVPAMAETLLAKKPSVLYLSFQECTGCLESLLNSGPPSTVVESATIENLILNLVSLDYQETIMAAAGNEAEAWRKSLIAEGGYVLVVDGSIPADPASAYFVSGGQSGVKRFTDAARKAGLVIAVGTCASFGGLPHAKPNPTGAVAIGQLMVDHGIDKPLLNVSGCPPIAEVITGVIIYYLTQGMPELDDLLRPTVFYGPTVNGRRQTVHGNCERRPFFGSTNRDTGTIDNGKFVAWFDDDAARQGHCLYELGCKGPRTHNACTTIKWNQGTSYPMKSGHGCIGCSEPNFWDGVYLSDGTFEERSFYEPYSRF